MAIRALSFGLLSKRESEKWQRADLGGGGCF